MALSSIPYSIRVWRGDRPQWGEWEERFAWYPQRIALSEDQLHDVGQITICNRVDAGHRWVWLKKYWQRQRLHQLAMIRDGKMVYEIDYAFDMYDLLTKT